MSDPDDLFHPLTRLGQTAEGSYIRNQREMFKRMAEDNRKSAERLERMHGSPSLDLPPAPLPRERPAQTLQPWPQPIEADEDRTNWALLCQQAAQRNLTVIRMKPDDAAMAYSYLREDGTLNADADGVLNEPELVTRNEHERRLCKAYQDHWQRELDSCRRILGDDLRVRKIQTNTGFTYPKPMVSGYLSTLSLAQDRLRLLEQGWFVWPRKAQWDLNWVEKYYWCECYLFRRCLFRIKNPLVRKVTIDKFDRLITRHLARMYQHIVKHADQTFLCPPVWNAFGMIIKTPAR